MIRFRLVAFCALSILAVALVSGCSDDDSTSPPALRTRAEITAPADGDTVIATVAVMLEGTGISSGGEPLYPERLSWYRNAVDPDSLLGAGNSLAVMLPAAGDRLSHVIYLVADEAPGASDTDSVTVLAMAPENFPPAVTVLEPLHGEDYLPAHVVTVLSGVATDREDGALAGAALSWRSSIDGPLGTGALLEARLTPGTHVLDLTATDGDGVSATASVTVTVRHRPAGPVVDGAFFFRAEDFTAICAAKDLSFVIGTCTVDVEGDVATMTITDMGGSLTCDAADVCLLGGESVQGNMRVTATGDLQGGGTLTLEISGYMDTPTTVQGLLRAVETLPGAEPCVYRSPVRLIANTQ